jgi:lipoprotein-releasing system permease protein
VTRAVRVGWPAAVQALLCGVHVVAMAALPTLASQVARPMLGQPDMQGALGGAAPFALAGAAAWLLALVVFGGWTVLRARRLAPGAAGRVRWLVLGSAAVVHVAALIPLSVLVHASLERALDIGLVPYLEWDQLLLGLPEGAVPSFYLLALVTLGTWLAMAGAATACWFLLPERVRRVAWVVIDAVLVAGAVAAAALLPFTPPADAPDALLGPAVAVAVTTLAAVRVLARFVRPLLTALEGMGFRVLVAARHLRARKSNFLAAIGTLSILAVAFSSCSLTTTLSVMGGFRQDLKQKILGNNAHIVVDREHATFDGWEPVLEATRQVPGVAAASPYVAGEVMVTSASNMTGAVLRGIDPKTVDQVLDLGRNMVRPDPGPGALDYLVHPERLLDLPPDVRRGPRTTVPSQRLDLDDPIPPPPGGVGLLADLGLLEDEPAGATAEEGREMAPAPPPSMGDDVLPGIVVGQELARSLRLYVGDEVNVVSPFGDLGPTGPMPKSRPFRVAGIFYSGMYEYDMKFAYVTLPVAQRFLNVGDAISGVEIKAADVEAAPAIAERVRGALGRDDLRVQDWQELNKNLFGALALEKLAMFITLGIAILVAGFCVFGTLTLMVQEKEREVGILKAMGTQSRDVVGVFLIEGLLIGVFGAAIGLGLGFVVCFVAEHFGIRMNPEVYYIDKLPVHVDPVDFVLVGVASATICLLATIFPATYASRLRPVDALRHD